MTPYRALPIAALLSVSPVHADDYVDKADANGDGSISLYELRAAYYADPEFNQQIEQSFGEYDLDGDGLITETELSARRPATIAEPAAAAAGAAAVAQGTSAETATPIITVVPNSGQEGPAAEIIEQMEISSEAEALAPEGPALSRSEAMVLEVDDDKNGRVSAAELSNGEDQWFSDKAFDRADTNGDGGLNADELEQLLQSQERRRR